MKKKREKLGKIATDLAKKEPDTRDPIELERAMHTNYVRELETTVHEGFKQYTDSFYVVVITKKEPLMPNVLRNYFFSRQSCPTPDYDQTVYRYDHQTDTLDFLWVIPSKDTCILFKQNALEIDPQERQLLKFVLDFADGTLFTLAKKLNSECANSPLLEA